MTRRRIIPLAVLGAVLALGVGMAIAKSYTLLIAKNATVKPMGGTAKTESIVVDGRGFAVYWLSGESTSHPLCSSSACLQFWPPLKVSGKAHLSAQPGIHGKVGTWKRDGFTQVTLGGHPLYMFSLDKTKHDATGEGVMSFGGTWHVALPSGRTSSSSHATTTTSTSTTYSYSTSTAPTTSTSTSASTSTTSTVCTGPYCYGAAAASGTGGYGGGGGW